MSETIMNLARFEALVEAYGANEAHWPLAERGAARALAQREPQAAALLAEARALDDLLAFDNGPAAPSDLLRARILARAPKAASGRPPSAWAPYAALAACAVFGALIGLGGGLLVPTPSGGAAQAGLEAPLAPVDAPQATNGEEVALDGDAADLMIEVAFGAGPEDSDWLGDGG